MKLDHGVAAVVTGGASGLGAASVRALAERGVKVGIFDTDLAAGSALAQEVGGVFARVDVTSDDDVTQGFARARDVHGQERVLVNCAGTAEAIRTVRRDAATGELVGHPIANLRRIIEVNLIGTFRCVVLSAKGMMTLTADATGERGVIVNTGSISSEDGQIGQTAYAASKAAVAGMTLPLARDFMDDGLRVNTIMPGIFDTPMMAAAPTNVRAALAAVPFPKRPGMPAEYAAMVVAMIENGYLNGASLRLDGAIRFAPR